MNVDLNDQVTIQHEANHLDEEFDDGIGTVKIWGEDFEAAGWYEVRGGVGSDIFITQVHCSIAPERAKRIIDLVEGAACGFGTGTFTETVSNLLAIAGKEE